MHIQPTYKVWSLKPLRIAISDQILQQSIYSYNLIITLFLSPALVSDIEEKSYLILFFLRAK